MPELIINTGPLIALCAAVEDLQVLKSCYACIHVPRMVADEIIAGSQGAYDLERIRSTELFEIAEDRIFLDPYLTSALDPGEAAVIASALSLGVSTVSIDEKIGRRVARLHGLSVTGSTGMLLKCANSGGISDLDGCFSAMRKKGIWISESITRNALLHWQEGGG